MARIRVLGAQSIGLEDRDGIKQSFSNIGSHVIDDKLLDEPVIRAHLLIGHLVRVNDPIPGDSDYKKPDLPEPESIALLFDSPEKTEEIQPKSLAKGKQYKKRKKG